MTVYAVSVLLSVAFGRKEEYVDLGMPDKSVCRQKAEGEKENRKETKANCTSKEGGKNRLL